jgi:small-conductance mechanosensitive channel
VSQTDNDIQLQVWKDLAISKQILMGAAADALGLDAECSTDELKTAMNKAILQAKNADITIIETREQTEKEIFRMEARVASSEQAMNDALELVASAEAARKAAESKLVTGRAENAEALKKIRAEVTDKQNKLKAISKALADTPENVIKKLKTLKKQKMDEARLRTQTESKLQSIRKQKTKLEGELENSKALMAQSAPLIAQLKELHAIAKKQRKKLKSLSDDKKNLIEIPKLDEELLETIEKAISDK